MELLDRFGDFKFSGVNVSAGRGTTSIFVIDKERIKEARFRYFTNENHKTDIIEVNGIEYIIIYDIENPNVIDRIEYLFIFQSKEFTVTVCNDYQV